MMEPAVKRLVLGLGVLALGVIAVPAAQSASSSDCLGKVPNVLGTSGNDAIVVYVDEAGLSGTVNGRSVRDEDAYLAVIYSKGGNDKIHFQGDPGRALICVGDGKDTITGDNMLRVHAGSGYDTVRQYLQCGNEGEVFAAETVRTSYDSSGDPGPCN